MPLRRYQVFISSTYSDLTKERQAVTWEIMEHGHIPVGMESFTAHSDRGWKTIKRAIDVTDYYVLILSGRYGDINPEWGQSWMHREYEYAHSIGVPVLAFVRDKTKIPLSAFDTENASLLSALIHKVRSSHLVKEWKEQDDLCALVGAALSRCIREDEANLPRPGWYRGISSPDANRDYLCGMTQAATELSGDSAILLDRAVTLFRSAEKPYRIEADRIMEMNADLFPYEWLIDLDSPRYTKHERAMMSKAIGHHSLRDAKGLESIMNLLFKAPTEGNTYGYRILTPIRKLLLEGIELQDYSKYIESLNFFSQTKGPDNCHVAHNILQIISPNSP